MSVSNECRESSSSSKCTEVSQVKAWVTVSIAAFFFLYEFIQMDLFNVISQYLMHDFAITAAQLGTMSTFYFVANVLFLFVSGVLLDRYSARRIILLTLGLCIIATACFALTHNYYWACFFRFLTGVGGAFCFLSVVRLATRWFPASQMAFVTGVIVPIAFIGDIIAQTPLTILTQLFAWQSVVLMDAVFGVAIWLLILWVVTDAPKGGELQQESNSDKPFNYITSYKRAFLNTQNWLAGCYTCLMNFPVGLLGGLWGVIYLIDVFDLTRMQASWVTTCMFIGTIFGCPIFGWVSDHLRSRCIPMLVGAVLSFVLVSILIFSDDLSYMNLLMLFVGLGFFTSSQVIGYPLVAESSPEDITATSVSVVNICTQFGIMFSQPFFGFLLDKHARVYLHHTQVAIHRYMAVDFQWAVLLFPLGMLFSVLLVFLIKETHCKQQVSTSS